MTCENVCNVRKEKKFISNSFKFATNLNKKNFNIVLI